MGSLPLENASKKQQLPVSLQIIFFGGMKKKTTDFVEDGGADNREDQINRLIRKTNLFL